MAGPVRLPDGDGGGKAATAVADLCRTLLNAALAVGGPAGLLLVFAATAWAAGDVVAHRILFPGRRPPVASDVFVTTAFGLVLLATAGFALGCFGQLTRGPVVTLTLAVHVAALRRWRSLGQAWLPPTAPTTATELVGDRRRWWPVCAATTLALPWFALALYPPTAFDETLYHLPFARAFVESGALPFLPDLRFPVFPQAGEVLGALLLMFDGSGADIAPHLVALLATGLVAGLLWRWGHEWAEAGRGGVADIGGIGGGKGIGGIAAAAWLGNPMVLYLSGSGYVEPLLALFFTAASYCIWRWRRSAFADAGSSAESPGWLLLSAAFAGGAAATKYLGLFPVAALGLTTLWISVRNQQPGTRQRWTAPLLFGATALATLAPWYLRLVAWTGNPVFPYFSGWFGANDWTPIRFFDLALPGGDWTARLDRLAHAAGQLATLGWDVVARRDRVGGLPPISPAYLLAAPLVLFAAWRERALRQLLWPALLFVALFPLLPADARYLVAVLPIASLAVGISIAHGAESLSRRSPGAGAGSHQSHQSHQSYQSHQSHQSQRRPLRRGTVLLAVLIALPGWCYAGYRIARQGAPPTDAAARERYLRRALPFYPALAAVNERVRPGDVVYGMHVESIRSYSRARFLGDWYGPHRYALLDDVVANPAAFGRRLAEWNVNYLVVSRRSDVAEALTRAAPGTPLREVFEDAAAVVYAVAPNDRRSMIDDRRSPDAAPRGDR
jgi:hypothetical protein